MKYRLSPRRSITTIGKLRNLPPRQRCWQERPARYASGRSSAALSQRLPHRGTPREICPESLVVLLRKPFAKLGSPTSLAPIVRSAHRGSGPGDRGNLVDPYLSFPR